jgi:signal transduction histidine kinase
MSLWQTIDSAREELLGAFARKLADAGSEREPDADPPAEITGLLDQLVVSLRAVEAGKNATLLPAARALAADLGEAGAEEGRAIGAVVTDFLALHEAILEVAHRCGEAILPQEQRALARGINRAIAAAASRYAHARDRELGRAHAEHFAFLAHELRTPLTSIKMGVDLIAQGLDPKAIVPRVRRSVGRLQQLVDNELTQLRLSSEAPLNVERIRPAALLHEIVEELRLHASDASLALTLDAPDDIELDADPRLLRSAVGNLVANAVKFSRAGGTIAVSVRRDGGHIVFAVADACGGLPPGRAESLFAPYQQAGTDRSGFGLGLAIVADAVERHGGLIEVVDRPGAGCEIVLRFPERASTQR